MLKINKVTGYLDLEPPKGSRWTPPYYCVPQNAVSTRGPAVARFSQQFIRVREGVHAGRPFTLTQWQEWVVNALLATAEDGLYCSKMDLLMIPRKNGKTSIIAIIVLYALLTAEPEAQIYSAAKTQSQARIVFDMIKSWIRANRSLQKIFKIEDSYSRIVNVKTGAFYKALASDGGATNGLNPALVIFDELHAVEGLTTSAKANEFWASLSSGGGAQPNYKLIVISTAGANVEDSILGSLYKRGMAMINGDSKDTGFTFMCWQAPDDAEIEDEACWYLANPNLAEGILLLENIRSDFRSYAATGLHTFRRNILNQWVSIQGERYVPDYLWADSTDLTAAIPKGAHVTVGFDGSLTDDSTVIVYMDYKTGVFKTWQAWERPANIPKKDWRVPVEEVRTSMERLFTTHRVLLLYADNSYFEADVVRWAKEYNWPVTSVPQAGSRMIEGGIAWKKRLAEKEISHPADDTLDRHMQNAFIGENGRYRKATKGSTGKIDALVASVLASMARDHLIEKSKRVVRHPGGILNSSRR